MDEGAGLEVWFARQKADPGSVSEFLSPSELFPIIMVSVFDFQSCAGIQVSGFRTHFEVFETFPVWRRSFDA
jgi:hypothetical protein